MTDVSHFPYGDYLYDGNIGDVVEIPILNTLHKAIVIEQDITSPFQLKKAKYLGFSVKDTYIKFLQEFALRNITEISSILKTILSSFSKSVTLIEQIIHIPNIHLNDQQQLVLDQFRTYNKSVFLLWGITGSGKTETFFKIACDVLQKGQQVLLILPEILLNESIAQRFSKMFQCKKIIWNSKTRNKSLFMSIVTGSAKFIIGTRSAIFLPFNNLGLIIIDEEHDKIHKQETRLVYNCRDMSVVMGKKYNIPVILSSATPSLESYYQVLENNYKLLRLTKRFSGTLPNIQIHRTLEMLPKETLNACEKVLGNNEQVIFFLNRRGFANYVVCIECKCNITCKVCNLNIVWHKKKNIFMCHRCNKIYTYEKCPECCCMNSLSCLGYGVEKVSYLLQQQFKTANIAVLSSDFYEKKQSIYDFIDKMKNNKINIVVGTQMITKGLDFAGVTLVVVLNFNQSGFDFRLSENTFQTLLQISGRAGRHNTTSTVIVQTSQTRNTVLDFFKKMDYENFLKHELEQRKLFQLPPFTKIVSIKSPNVEKLEQKIKKLNINIISNKQDTIFLKIDLHKYIPVASEIRKILRSTKEVYKVDIDPYDILY